MCPNCGTHEDWWNPEKGGHRDLMQADTVRCRGCELKEQERADIPKDAKGIHVQLVPNPELTGATGG